jgi:hypothetical protein
MNSESGGFQPLSGGTGSGKRNLSPMLIAIVALAAFVVVFILKNRDWTTIDFVLFEMRNRVWTAIAFSIGLGVLLDRLVLMWWRRRKADRADA